MPVIGLMAAAGAIFIARKILAPKAEQIFYAMFLIMIAAFYLAFAAYFGVALCLLSVISVDGGGPSCCKQW
jgi:hypothetical protein